MSEDNAISDEDMDAAICYKFPSPGGAEGVGAAPVDLDVIAVEHYIDGYGHGQTLEDYRAAKRGAREALHRLAARLRSPGDGSRD